MKTNITSKDNIESTRFLFLIISNIIKNIGKTCDLIDDAKSKVPDMPFPVRSFPLRLIFTNNSETFEQDVYNILSDSYKSVSKEIYNFLDNMNQDISNANTNILYSTSCFIMKSLNIKNISITFSGSGDSGDIDNVSFDIELNKLNNNLVTFSIPNLHENDFHNTCIGLVSILTDHYDWVNNEGGGGEVIFYLKDNNIITNTNFYYNIIERIDESIPDFYLLGGEELDGFN